MENKKRLKTAIRQLRSFFKEDIEAQKALNGLEEKVNLLPSEKSKDNERGGIFPVPPEVDKIPNAFAVFSDGACRGNPGPGAWGAMVQDEDGNLIFESSGINVTTTNNQMELEGAIKGLEGLLDYFEDHQIKINGTKIYLYSDSKYVVDGMGKWVPGWKRRGWKKSDNKEPENLFLWKKLDQLYHTFPKVDFRWVKGHDGHPQNERCDELANNALDDSGF